MHSRVRAVTVQDVGTQVESVGIQVEKKSAWDGRDWHEGWTVEEA